MSDDATETPTPAGFRPQKFIVRHWRRGDLLDGEAFVLVPERDPAAVAAIVAYARATPDAELAAHLREWAARVTGEDPDVQAPELRDVVPSWVATLSALVRAKRMTVETALFRIVGLATAGERS